MNIKRGDQNPLYKNGAERKSQMSRKIKNLQNEKNIFNCCFISRFNICM